MKAKNIFKKLMPFSRRHIKHSAPLMMQIIEFGEVTRNGLVFNKDMKVEVDGKIEKMIIDEHGIKIITSFDLESVSLQPARWDGKMGWKE